MYIYIYIYVMPWCLSIAMDTRYILFEHCDGYSVCIHTNTNQDAVSDTLHHCNWYCVFGLCIHMTHFYVWHDKLMLVTWHNYKCERTIHMCDMTRSYVWHDSFMCDMIHPYVYHDSFICVTWLIHMCDTTHSYVWHDSFICVVWLIHMCDMTHSYLWHDSIICTPWRIHKWVMSHITHSITYLYICIHTYEWVMSHIWMCRGTCTRQSRKETMNTCVFTPSHRLGTCSRSAV